jgi:hypothetical protein
MLCGDRAGILESSGIKGEMGEQVHLSRQPIGSLKEGNESRLLKEGDFGSSQAQPVFEVGRQFVLGEPADVVTDNDSLG